MIYLIRNACRLVKGGRHADDRRHLWSFSLQKIYETSPDVEVTA